MMSEKIIYCPHCHSELSLDEQYLWMEVSCPNCSKEFIASPDLENPEEPQEEILQKPEPLEPLKELETIPQKETAPETPPAKKSFKLNFNKLPSLSKQKMPIKSDEEEDLPEPEPGFVTEEKVRRTAKEIVTGILKKTWKIFSGAFLSIFMTLETLSVTKVLDKETVLILLCIICYCVGIVVTILIIYLLYNRFASFSKKVIWKRDLVKQYFDIQEKMGIGLKILNFIFDFVDNIPFLTFITQVISGIMQYSMQKYREKRFPYYDEVQAMDMKYLQKLNVLRRFGKDKTQLVSPMETLFAPAFDGVPHLMSYAALVEESDDIYRYNLEAVTKIYTFEDQLFLYTGIWDYSLGKMLAEDTEAFFFKDITDVRTESNYKISTKYVKNGCLSMIVPWFGKHIRTVYKESETFMLTASSGNSISVTIGFEEAIAASGATYTHRNQNERIIHAIRKMIEEKKNLANG